MDSLYNIIPEDIAYALGWTVIHSFWQALLLAFILLIIRFSWQKKSATRRYLAANALLWAQLFVSVITFLWLLQPLQTEMTVTVDAEAVQQISVEVQSDVTVLSTPFSFFTDYFDEHLPLIICMWLAGLAFFLLRLLGGLAYVQHLRHYRVSPMPLQWNEKLADLTKRLGLNKPVGLLESASVSVPIVIGVLKPVILLPAGVLTMLTPAQLEAVIAHELAHIYRRDYLLNIIQSILEAIYYFNPAVWWISAYIRIERENCCDDIAVELCHDSLSYARALLTLEESVQYSPRLAMALANKGKGKLLFRIRRILNQPQKNSFIMEKFAASAILLLALFLLSFGAASKSDTEQASFTYSLEPLNDLLQKKRSEITISVNDTLPKGNVYIRTEDDDQSMEVKIKDGEIQSLKIDGETIPESDYEKYESDVADILENRPVPPSPPTPPTPPAAPVPPVAPTPPTAPVAPTPPTPPAPPAPPAAPKAPNAIFFSEDGEGTAFRFEEDGQTIIIESKDGDEEIIHIPPHFNSFHTETIDIEGFANFEDFVVWEQEFETIGEQEIKEIKKELKSVRKQLKKNLSEKQVRNLREQERALHEAEKALRDIHSARVRVEVPRMEIAPGAFNVHTFHDTDGAFVFSGMGNMDHRFERALRRDGFIQGNEPYKLELKGKGSLRINGKKQPEAVYQRYRQLYESITGDAMNSKDRFVIDKTGGAQ